MHFVMVVGDRHVADTLATVGTSRDPLKKGLVLFVREGIFRQRRFMRECGHGNALPGGFASTLFTLGLW
jgi:hypothetical protein